MNVAIIIAIVVIVVILAVGAYFFTQKRRTDQLKDRFGPEYDHAVDTYGDRRTAEPVLLAREKRVKNLEITPLSDEDRARFADSWSSVQARFVDDPGAAVGQADTLVARVMETRGYPMGDFEQRAADISVDHPQIVSNYRAAHELALQQSRGQADTEELRKAMIYYRSLFDELLESPSTDDGADTATTEAQPAEASS